MAMSKWIPITDLRLLRRFGKLAEELAELQSVVARCIIQGVDEVDPSSGRTNRERITDEVADVLAQCDLTISELGLDFAAIRARVHEKKRQMAEWESLF